jgi:membrane fusion protein (multidrug efflux system)
MVNAQGFRAEPEVFTTTISATGNLHAWEEVELLAPVAGNVTKIHFEEGQFVSKGQPIIEIDSRAWKAQKRGLEAQLANAKIELQRREQLLDIEGTSQESVDQARTAIAELQSRIDELNVRIDLAYVTAPFSGRLGLRDFSTGSFMTVGTPITRLVQTDKLKISFDVPARYASLVNTGANVNVIASGTPDTTIARIYAIEPVINASNRSLKVRGELENGRGRFISGDFAQVQMTVDVSQDALLIPSESIISELNSQIVYVFRNGKAVRTPVEMGASTRGRVEIVSGISVGDTILITGLMSVRDNMPVNIASLNQEAGL